jgi:hypothetical protein
MGRHFIANNRSSQICGERLIKENFFVHYTKYYFYVHTVHFYCLLFICTNKCTYIKILNYITCFDVSAPSSGSFHKAFAEVIKLLKLHKTGDRFMITFEFHVQPLPCFINSTDFILQRSTV